MKVKNRSTLKGRSPENNQSENRQNREEWRSCEKLMPYRSRNNHSDLAGLRHDGHKKGASQNTLPSIKIEKNLQLPTIYKQDNSKTDSFSNMNHIKRFMLNKASNLNKVLKFDISQLKSQLPLTHLFLLGVANLHIEERLPF